MRMLLVAVLLACCAVPTAAALPGDGLIAYQKSYFGIDAADPERETGLHLVGSALGPPAGAPMEWSPDGAHLLYQGFGAAVVNADGSGAHELTAKGSKPECWLDADTAVVRMGGDFYAVRFDGSGLSPLATGLHDFGADGTCTPASRTFFFTRTDGEHYAVTPGEVPMRLPIVGGELFPAPNGKLLAWSTEAGLFLVAPDPTIAVRKLGDPVPHLPVLWTPDSQEISFFEAGPKIVDVATGATRRLVNLPYLWSPDGTKMFTRTDFGYLGAIANADGTCPHAFVSTSPMSLTSGFAWQPVPGRAPSASFRCPELSLHGEAAPDPVFPEEVATFTFTVTNQGNEAASYVALEIEAFDNGAFVSSSPSSGTCDADGKRCELGALSPGASASMTVRLRAPAEFTDPRIAVLVRETGPGASGVAFSASTTLAQCALLGTDGRDELIGTYRDETVCGLRGPDRLEGRGGRDVVVGGLGQDRLYGGSGSDRIVARDGQRDRIDCGSGFDTVVADPVDRVAKNCENVSRNPR
jgi:hypothetical protein